MFEELNNDELMIIDGGFAWKWLIPAAIAVIGAAVCVVSGIGIAALGGAVVAGVASDIGTITMIGLCAGAIKQGIDER